MSKKYLDEIVEESQRVFGSDSLEWQVLSYFYGLLDKLGANFEGITLGGVASDLSWYSDQSRRVAISSALDYLASRFPPLLVRRYELWGEDTQEVLGQPICTLSDDDIREALETNELINPISGRAVPNFLDLVSVIYVLDEQFRKELPSGGGK